MVEAGVAPGTLTWRMWPCSAKSLNRDASSDEDAAAGESGVAPDCGTCGFMWAKARIQKQVVEWKLPLAHLHASHPAGRCQLFPALPGLENMRSTCATIYHHAYTYRLQWVDSDTQQPRLEPFNAGRFITRLAAKHNTDHQPRNCHINL